MTASSRCLLMQTALYDWNQLHPRIAVAILDGFGIYLDWVEGYDDAAGVATCYRRRNSTRRGLTTSGRSHWGLWPASSMA